MKITIQVFAPPYSYEDLDTAIKIAEAGLDKGHEVTVFLFADSILSVNSKVKPIRIDRDIPRKLESLIQEKGLKVEICGICMDYRGVTKDMIIPGSRPSGLPELASLIYNSDRFVNLMA
ncbi:MULTISPECIES: DsrE/DsrF/TusD sulfur relay family protein [unclassified Mesotoga]|uniref:DsrE/DsrF/TusD sulfur relay family protein n=1 Tax=unclassified Mesotoga TaxID=1184398 RepID=UPI000CCBDB6C|nr:DsrE family protein [Mesotoga sp. B105.6.4]PNS42299.1 sulfur reduction protein DsrE [Mesotoga sp. B105.6.4]